MHTALGVGGKIGRAGVDVAVDKYKNHPDAPANDSHLSSMEKYLVI